MPAGATAALSCGAGGARLCTSYTAAAPGPVTPPPAHRRLFGCAKRRKAALRAAAALLCVAAALASLAACLRTGAAPRAAVRPRRALAFVPVYALFPYGKLLDCFTLGLAPLFLADMLQCVAYTTV